MPRRSGGTRPGGARLTWLLPLVLAFAAACNERSRPSPAEPGVGLDVVVVSPSGGGSFHPGALSVSVRGHDAVGRLSGLGVILRTSGEGAQVDSTATAFASRTDTTVVLHVQLPHVVQHQAFELVAFATDDTGGQVLGIPVDILVLPCPATGC